MSCFFCDSNFHVSHNCDKFVSDKSRCNIVSLKNCCPNCLGYLDAKRECANKCKLRYKCFICFSQGHSTIYCPDRAKVLHMFSPKIDEDLLFRFGQLLPFEDKCSLAISYPNMFEIIKLKPLKVKFNERIYYSKMQNYLNYDLIVADNCVFNKPHSLPFPDEILPLNPPIFHIKNLDINCSKASSLDLLLLLSSKTISLKCSFYSEFLPKLILREILEKAPKLEEAEIYQTNITADNSWPDDIVRLSRADNLQKLHFTITDLNFNMESLIALLMKTSAKIYLSIIVSSLDDVWSGMTTIKNKLSKNFNPRLTVHNDVRIIFAYRIGQFGKFHYDCFAFTEQ